MTWRHTRLKHLAELPIRNGLGEAGAFDDPAWPRYVRTTDIAGPRKLRDDVFASLPPVVASKAMLAAGDILMTTAGATIGKSTTFTEGYPACYAGFLARFRPSEAVDGRFIAYWMQSTVYWDQINAGAVRSTIENFSASKYQNLYIAVPSLDVQRRIADFLDDQVTLLDQAIALRQQQIDLLAERLTSYKGQVVTKGLDPSVQMTDSEVPWIGIMPTSWSLLRFGYMLARANAGEVIDKSWWGEGPETLFTCARESILSNFNTFPLEKRTTPQDILITRNATPYVHLPQPGAIYSNVVQRVTLDPNVNREWARYALGAASSSMHGYGVSIDTLNFGMWKSLKIPVPTRSEQDRIVEHLNQEGASVAQLLQHMTNSKSLIRERKQSLITAVVTGGFDATTARSVT